MMCKGIRGKKTAQRRGAHSTLAAAAGVISAAIAQRRLAATGR